VNTLTEFSDEMRRLSRLLDSGLDVLRETAESLAQAESAYRKAKALAWVDNPTGTAKQREAKVDADTADLRYERDVADGVRRAAIESVRARATQISALQSLLAAHKAEAGFDRTAPREGP
jgi:hypothetical protein